MCLGVPGISLEQKIRDALPLGRPPVPQKNTPLTRQLLGATLLGCPRKLGSMVSKWKYNTNISHLLVDYNLAILCDLFGVVK